MILARVLEEFCVTVNLVVPSDNNSVDAAFTVNEQRSTKFPALTEIKAVPALNAFTRPFESTVATVGLLEDHTRVGFSVLGAKTAENCTSCASVIRNSG